MRFNSFVEDNTACQNRRIHSLGAKTLMAARKATPWHWFLKTLLSVCSLALLAMHMVDRFVAVDYTTVALLILAALPWIIESLFRVDLPGRFKFDFREQVRVLEEVVRELPEILPTSATKRTDYIALVKIDPNLALTAVRLDLERALRVGSSNPQQQARGVLHTAKLLLEKDEVTVGQFIIITRILPILNKAGNGLSIDVESATRVALIGADLIACIQPRNN